MTTQIILDKHQRKSTSTHSTIIQNHSNIVPVSIKIMTWFFIIQITLMLLQTLHGYFGIAFHFCMHLCQIQCKISPEEGKPNKSWKMYTMSNECIS